MFRIFSFFSALIFLISVSFFSANTETVFAEGAIMALDTGSTLTIVPPYPSAGESVRATIKTVKTDVSSALVSWTLNGKTVFEGRNASTFDFVAGDAGATMQISATVRPDVGTPITKSLSFSVSDVALVWEANTYTPPLYQGRALQSVGASVNVLALPRVKSADGSFYNPNTLSYEWYTDSGGTPLYSGYGLTSVTLTNPNPFAALHVTVKVKDRTGTVRAVRNIDIPVTPAYILFYPDSPLLGIRYEDPFMGEYNLSGESLTVVAEPYFLSAERRTDPNLSYLWTVGTQTLDTPGSIVLRPEGSGSGAARIRLSIQGKSKESWAQRVEGKVNIVFNTEASSVDTTPL